MEPIGEIDGILKYEGGDYVPLETIKNSTYALYRHIFYGILFGDDYKTVEDGMAMADSVIIDIVVDNKTTIKDPHRQGATLEYVTNFPGAGYYIGFVKVPSYDKFVKPGKHTIQIKVAPRKLGQYMKHRDFSPEAGGVISPVYTYEIIEDRQLE